jgi:hypothetical protein
MSWGDPVVYSLRRASTGGAALKVERPSFIGFDVAVYGEEFSEGYYVGFRGGRDSSYEQLGQGKMEQCTSCG